MFNASKFRIYLQIGLVCLINQAVHAAPKVDWLKIRQTTVDKFKAGVPISWTATHQVDDTTSIRVDTILSGTLRRNTLTRVDGETETPIAQISARDELWYVTAGDQHTRDRPYETIFKFPAVYYYLQISDLQLLNPSELGNAESIKDGIATFREPLSSGVQSQMRERVTRLKAVRPEATSEDQEKIDTNIRLLEENITKGAIATIDAATGVVLERFIPGRQSTISNLRWLDTKELSQFEVADQQWEDRTASITTKDNLDLAMFLYSADVEDPQAPHDAVLVNLATGLMRRVPVPFSTSIPGCFTKDRKKVLVLATGPKGGLLPFEVDLVTRNARMVDLGALAGGIVFDPVVSPQGQWLGLLHKMDPAKQEWQVCALNLKTADVRMLGRPMAVANLSWLPETNGVILARHEFAGYKKPPKSTISQMDLKGKLKPIRRGNSPFLLSVSKRILYQGNEADTLWYTCALDGSDSQLIGDGLEGFHDPSVSPDEKRLLMVKGESANLTRPFVIDMKSGGATPLDVPAGSWLNPAWR